MDINVAVLAVLNLKSLPSNLTWFLEEELVLFIFESIVSWISSLPIAPTVLLPSL